ESRGSQLRSRGRKLRRGRIVSEMHRFEVDVPDAQRASHLDRLLTREVPQRVTGNAELDPAILAWFVGNGSNTRGGVGGRAIGERHSSSAECRPFQKGTAWDFVIRHRSSHWIQVNR